METIRSSFWSVGVLGVSAGGVPTSAMASASRREGGVGLGRYRQGENGEREQKEGVFHTGSCN
jgi:hypothetical protein